MFRTARSVSSGSCALSDPGGLNLDPVVPSCVGLGRFVKGRGSPLLYKIFCYHLLWTPDQVLVGMALAVGQEGLGDETVAGGQ